MKLLVDFPVLVFIVFFSNTLFASEPIAWWPGDGNATDAVGTYDGELKGSSTYGPGKIGEAFSVPGNGSYVYIPNTVNIDGGAEFTVMAWVNLQSTVSGNAYSTVLAIGDGSTSGYLPEQARLLYYPNGSFYVEFGTDDNNTVAIRRSEKSYPFQAWHFVVATFKNGAVDLYVNGELDNGSGSTGGTTINQNAKNFVVIGSTVREDQSVNVQNFNGRIDEVAIYDEALSALQIVDIYDNGIQPPRPGPFPEPIPAIGPLGLLALAGGLASFGAWRLRRRRG